MTRQLSKNAPDSPIVPKLIIHGGSGSYEGKHASLQRYDQALRAILRKTWGQLLKKGAREACFGGMRMLEDEPLFNAGYGSKLQQDGTVPCSPSLILRYLALHNVCHIHSRIQRDLVSAHIFSPQYCSYTVWSRS